MIDPDLEGEPRPEPTSWLEEIAKLVATAGEDELEALEQLDIPGVTIGASDVDLNERVWQEPASDVAEAAWG